MNKYYVFTALFFLAVFLWMSVIFWLTADAAGAVGFCAAVLTIALVAYGWNNTENK
jgi:hypothetical protein